MAETPKRPKSLTVPDPLPAFRDPPRDMCYCGQCDGHHGHPDGPATAPAAPSVADPASPVDALLRGTLNSALRHAREDVVTVDPFVAGSTRSLLSVFEVQALCSELSALRSSLEEARKERDELRAASRSNFYDGAVGS